MRKCSSCNYIWKEDPTDELSCSYCFNCGSFTGEEYFPPIKNNGPVKPVPFDLKKWHNQYKRLYDYSDLDIPPLEELPKSQIAFCNHEWVDVGFTHSKIICKKCNIEKSSVTS